MADSFSLPGIDLPSPTLSARLGELAAFLAAPTTGRLTEEQRALSLGIARRLVADVAAELDPTIDAASLWSDWLAAGVPAAGRLTVACFARAEEHRWREQSAQRTGTPAPTEPGDVREEPAPAVPPSDADRAYLALQIADRRRFDNYGHPRLALADIDGELFRALLLDIAAWRLAAVAKESKAAADLGTAVRDASERRNSARGIDAAAKNYHEWALAHSDPGIVAAAAIARHDWVALIALAAVAGRRSYGDTALALLSAEAAALPFLLAPLKIERAALAPLEASLTSLPARSINGGGGDE
jgi:hypothetical protein